MRPRFLVVVGWSLVAHRVAITHLKRFVTGDASIHTMIGPRDKWTNPRDAQCLLFSPYVGGAPYHLQRKQIKTRKGLWLLSFSTRISTVAGHGDPWLKETRSVNPRINIRS